MLKSFKDYIDNRSQGPNLKNEYLSDKGKMVDKAKVALVADYDGPDAKTPPKSQGGDAPAPYKAANGNQKPQKGENGFADLGDKKLVYNPDMKPGASKMTALGKELGGDWPKGKTESFLQSTRNMKPNEFLSHYLEACTCNSENLPTVTAYEAGPFHPHPSEAVRYVAAVTSQNDKMLENLVHEMKRSGTLGKMLEAILEHPEAYRALTSLFEDEADGDKRSKAFARAMNDHLGEAVGPPMGLTDDEEEDMPDQDEAPEDEEHPDDFEDSDEDEESEDDKDMGDEEESGDDHGEGEENMGDDLGQEYDPLNPDKSMGPPGRSMMVPPKKKHHLSAAMGSFESIKNVMKAYLS